MKCYRSAESFAIASSPSSHDPLACILDVLIPEFVSVGGCLHPITVGLCIIVIQFLGHEVLKLGCGSPNALIGRSFDWYDLSKLTVSRSA